MERRWALAGLALGYAVLVVLATLNSSATEFGDTYRYLTYSILDQQNPGIVASGVLQWAGSPRNDLWAQAVLSAISWWLLTVAVIDRLSYRWNGWLIGLVVLMASVTTPVWSWNTLLASESTAITCGALWLAAGVWLTGAATSRRLIAFVLSSALLIVARPQAVILVLAVSIVAIVWVLRRTGRAIPSVVAGLIMLLATVWGWHRLASLADEPKYRLYYAMNNLVDKESYRDYALSRMPRCAPIEALLAGPQPWPDMFAFRAGPVMGSCPEAYLWLKGPAAGTTSWLVAAPWDSFQGFVALLSSWILPVYSEGRALPGALGSFLSGGPRLWTVTLVAIVMGIGIAAFAGYRWKQTIVSVVATAGVLLALLVNGWVIWAADGLEHDRHLLPLTLLAVVAALVMPSALVAPSTTSAGERTTPDVGSVQLDEPPGFEGQTLAEA